MVFFLTMKRTIRRLSICERCHGTGQFGIYDPVAEETTEENCSLCKGMGIVLQTVTIELTPVLEPDLQRMQEVKQAKN